MSLHNITLFKMPTKPTPTRTLTSEWRVDSDTTIAKVEVIDYSPGAGALPFAIYVGSVRTSGKIVNEGTIWVAPQTGPATGIHGNTAAIDNRGTILASGQYALGIDSPSGLGSFANSGAIYAHAYGIEDHPNSYGYAVAVQINRVHDGLLLNSGLIAAFSANSVAVGLSSYQGGALRNGTSGAILAEGAAAIAVEFTTGLFEENRVENAGRIEALASSSQGYSIGIYFGEMTGDLVNSGTIKAQVAVAAADYVNYVPNRYFYRLSNLESGEISGHILLADGDDTVDNQGRVAGDLVMGGGNDVVVNAGQIAGWTDLGLGDDRYDGTAGTITAGAVDGGWGNDLLTGGASADQMVGGRGRDELRGGAGDDLLLGGFGNDLIIGDAGNDGLFGEYGDDLIRTSGGDYVDAGTGNDRIEAGDLTFEAIHGGAGFDTLVLSPGARTFDLSAALAEDALSGIERIELQADQAMVLRAGDVAGMSGGASLFVVGGASNRVELIGGWSQAPVQTIDGAEYKVFVSGEATVLVAAAATSAMVATVPADAKGLDPFAGGSLAPLMDEPGRLQSTDPIHYVAPMEVLHEELIDADEIWIAESDGKDTFGIFHFPLINHGTLLATSTAGYMIGLDGDDTMSLINTGTIIAEGRGSVRTLFDVGRLDNQGYIGAIGSGETVAAHVSVYDGEDGTANLRFANSGEIVADSTGLNVWAVQLEAYETHGTRMTGINEGTIRAIQTTTEPKDYPTLAVGMQFRDITASFQNTGLIEAASIGDPSTHVAGILVSDSWAETRKFEILNSGTIRATKAIWVPSDSYNAGLKIVNSGLIDGNVVLNSGGDIIQNSGTITGLVTMDYGNDRFDGAAGEAASVSGGWGSDEMLGGKGADRFASHEFGEAAAGTGGAFTSLDFLREVDTLAGGAGNDQLAAGYGDIVDGGAGTNSLALNLSGATAGLTIDFRALANGGTLTIGGGTIRGISRVVDVQGTGFADVLTAMENGSALTGGAGNDQLNGAGGNDLLVGGAGNDRMAGGVGNDIYVVDAAGDVVTELAGQGIDTIVVPFATFTLAATLENLTYSGATAFTGNGNDVANRIVGGGGNDRLYGLGGDDQLDGGLGNDSLWGGVGNDMLDGGAGADVLEGGIGDDVYLVDDAADKVVEAAAAGADTISTSLAAFTLAANVERLTYSGAAAFTGTGNDAANTITGGNGDDLLAGLGGNDVLRGGAGNDRLDGGAGSDSLNGGAGDDLYLVDEARDTILEAEGGGNDTVQTTLARYSLTGTHVETLIFAGTGSFEGTGSAGDDRIVGGGGNDSLIGLEGADRLSGDDGDDRLDGGAGNDVADYSGAMSAVAIDLARTGVQRGGGAGADTLVSIEGVIGSAHGDRLAGNGQHNLFDGGAGADEMVGRNGDDTYVVDNAADKVVELDGQGSDTVNASLSYSLAGQYVEVLNLGGDSAINGVGNGLANRIVGNAGANVLNGAGGNDRLDGGAGADTMIGGLGNDVFVIDDAGDKVAEKAEEGTDTIESSISYSLAGQYVEVLKLTGSADLNATGNGQANSLIGNSGENLLNGLGGVDTMAGSTGDDIYVVSDIGDKVVELAGEGTDTVQSSVTFTLAGQYAEILTLTGNGAINGTGNGLANVLTGNAAANTLNGGLGDDVLNGGRGADRLHGGAGFDTFLFDSALGTGNVDQILDFAAAEDTIRLDRSVFGALGPGALNAASFVAGKAAADADDRIVFDKASGNLWYDADGSGTGTAVLFANFGAGEVLTAADFVVVA